LAQLPFIVYNHPEAEEVVRKWSEPGYLETLTKSEQFKTEVKNPQMCLVQQFCSYHCMLFTAL
jgi:hypothetical protein